LTVKKKFEKYHGLEAFSELGFPSWRTDKKVVAMLDQTKKSLSFLITVSFTFLSLETLMIKTKT
jgi:hypothetical protein